MASRIQVQKALEVTKYVSGRLPQANVSCRDKALGLDEWVQVVRPVLGDVAAGAAALEEERRLQVLQSLGFILASGERHSQARGNEPGWIVPQLPGLGEALLAAAATERVPVLTSELYWERNAGCPPLSFTGEPHECFFISAVRTQTALRTVVNQQLRALLDGSWNAVTPEGARMLRAATAAMKEAHGQYLDFRRGPEGGPLMTPAQFNEMRAWLAPTAISGQTYAGANAAYIPEMVVTDFLLGTADTEYGRYVQTFDLYQSPAGKQLISQDRTRTSLTLVIANALGMDGQALDDASVSEVSDRMRQAPAALLWTLDAFKGLIDQFIGSSGAHVGLVHVYLEKYAREMPQEALDQLPVKPTHGTGGHSHDHTRRLHDMRRKCPRIRKLLAAIKEGPMPQAA